MDWYHNTCPQCFATLPDGIHCEKCGYDKTTARKHNDVLKQFSLLKSRYLVGIVLGKGGFGVTYTAFDTAMNQVCAIKEFMPSDYSERMENGLSVHPYSDQKSRTVFYHAKEKFLNEAKMLRQLKNNLAVVDILDCFEQNGTAYLAMEYLPVTVRQLARDNNGRLPLNVAYEMLVTIASALMEIHKMNILHRDITPENIMCTRNGVFKLIDFGAARSCGDQFKSVLLKRGYAPPEQYDTTGNQGPWTDIYGLCATYYYLVSGKRPEDGIERVRGLYQPTLFELNCGVDMQLSNAIVKGMEPDYRKRFQSCKEFLDAIDLTAKPQTKPDTGNRITGYGRQSGRWGRNTYRPSATVSEPQNVQVSPQEINQSAESAVSETGERAKTGQRQAQQSVQKTPVSDTVVPLVEVVAGPCSGTFATIKGNDIIKVGRSKIGCNLSMDYDSNISRVHCTVQYNRRRRCFQVTDYSTNGTFLENGSRLPAQKTVNVQINSRIFLASPGNMIQLKLVKG